MDVKTQICSLNEDIAECKPMKTGKALVAGTLVQLPLQHCNTENVLKDLLPDALTYLHLLKFCSWCLCAKIYRH